MQKLFGAAIAAFLLSGCATMVNGTKQSVSFITDPAGSTVTVEGRGTCTTPCSIKMKRADSTLAQITHPGFRPTSVMVHSKFGGAIALNLIPITLLGTVVDASDGASRFLVPNPVHVRLAPADSTQPAILVGKDGKDIGPLDDKGEWPQPAKSGNAAKTH